MIASTQQSRDHGESRLLRLPVRYPVAVHRTGLHPEDAGSSGLGTFGVWVPARQGAAVRETHSGRLPDSAEGTVGRKSP